MRLLLPCGFSFDEVSDRVELTDEVFVIGVGGITEGYEGVEEFDGLVGGEVEEDGEEVYVGGCG
jgi:hypothetical protein